MTQWTKKSTARIFHDFESEPALEGILVGVEHGVGKYQSDVYRVETLNRGTASIWGNYSIDEQLKDIKLNTLIRVEFVGKTRNKRGQEMRIFEVFEGGDEE